MARRIVVDLVDDIDGEKAVETVSFGLDGTFYEIDLSVHNSVELRTTFQAYIAEARTVPDFPMSRRGARTRRILTDQARMRRWARDNGWRIGDRGRLPSAVLDAYSAAHPR